jgi:hypothetical protein
MKRRDFLGSMSAIILAPMTLFKSKIMESENIDEKRFAALLFRDFVFWEDQQNFPTFYDYGPGGKPVPSPDQTIHGWLVTVEPEDELEYKYVYKIRLTNCLGLRKESIPLKIYKHRVRSRESFQDYLCEFTEDWVMGGKKYRQYVPEPKERAKLGKYFCSGAIC